MVVVLRSTMFRPNHWAPAAARSEKKPGLSLHSRLTFESMDQPAGWGVPQTDRAVLVTGRQQLSLGRQGNLHYVGCVAGNCPGGLLGRHIPELQAGPIPTRK